MTQSIVTAPETSSLVAAPSPAPQQQQQQIIDKLGPLVNGGIESEIRRIVKISDPDGALLLQEMCGTVLPILRDLAEELLKHRNYTVYLHNEHADQIDEQEARLGVLEDALGSDSQLTTEDAELFGKVVIIAEGMVEGARMNTTDPVGKQQLEEYAAMIAEAKQRIADIELVDADDDGAEGADDDTSADS